jgi:hypothetical protein
MYTYSIGKYNCETSCVILIKKKLQNNCPYGRILSFDYFLCFTTYEWMYVCVFVLSTNLLAFGLLIAANCSVSLVCFWYWTETHLAYRQRNIQFHIPEHGFINLLFHVTTIIFEISLYWAAYKEWGPALYYSPLDMNYETSLYSDESLQCKLIVIIIDTGLIILMKIELNFCHNAHWIIAWFVLN